MSEPEPAPEPNLFESRSRSRSGNKTFRLHNTVKIERRLPILQGLQYMVTSHNTTEDGHKSQHGKMYASVSRWWFSVFQIIFMIWLTREYELITEAHAQLSVVWNCSRSSLRVCLGQTVHTTQGETICSSLGRQKVTRGLLLIIHILCA